MNEEYLLTCRTCLKKCDLNNLKSLFVKNTSINCLTNANLLTECTSILVEENDGLPERICLGCFHKLNSSYEFKKLCENSYLILKLEQRKILETNQLTNCKIENVEEPTENDGSVLKEEIKDSENKCENDIKLEMDVVNGNDENYNLANRKRLTKFATKRRKWQHCSECKKNFKTNATLSIHISVEHNDKDKQTDETKLLDFDNERKHCYICNESIEDETVFKEHKERHMLDGSYCCLTCDKKYISLKFLKEHMSIHKETKIKIFKCYQCNKNLKTLKNLKWHLKIHEGVKKYLCTICGKNFLHPQSLRSHSLRHTGEKPYTCDLCGKVFRQHATLKYHKLSHSNERHHSCDICGKTYKRKDSLQTHLISHNAQKMYNCSSCDLAFKYHNSLKDHIRVVHEGIKFSCSLCDREYSSKKSYQKHVRQKHGGEVHENHKNNDQVQ